MVIMEHCTSMSYKIKELLLRAWRERWNEIEFGRNLKRLLPPSVSGDVYDLADCILRQAITGPVPNSLLMSYLNHCLCAQVVSFGSVILAITKISDPKPLCIFSFLEFICKYKSRIICYGNEDECLALSRALVALLHWLYQIISMSINEIQESKSQSSSASGLSQTGDNIHLQIVRLASEMLSCIASSSFLKTLLYVGKLEEPALWSLWCKLYLEVNSKLVLLSDKSLFPIVQIISNFQSNVEWLNASMDSANFLSSTPVVSVAIKQITTDPYYISYRPISYRSLHAVISFAAVLDLSSSIDVIANQLAMVGRFFDINLPQLYCESLHICLVNLIDFPKGEKNLKNLHSWIPFFLYKIPRIFLILSKHRTKFCSYKTAKDSDHSAPSTDLEAGLDLLLERVPLLDLFDLKYNGEYFQKLLEEFEKHSLLSSKGQQRFFESRKINANSASQNEARQSSNSSPTSSMLIVRAEQTLLTVFNSLDSEVPMGLLEILCRMQKSFVVILCSAATTGILDKFAQKLVALNELNKMSTGETSQASQLRAFLFDITFLSLCVLVDYYGTELITQNPATKDSFFANWCSLNLPDHNRLSPELIMNSYKDQPIKMDQHLNQFIVPNSSTEFKTSLVPWNEMCIVSQVAVSEMLTAWNSDSISYESVMVFLERLKSRLCCLAISGACWLFAQLKVVHQDQATKLMTMLNELNNISTYSSDSSGDNLDNSTDTLSLYYKERSSLMLSIMNRLFSKHLPSKLTDKDGATGLSNSSLYQSYNNPSATTAKSVSIPIRLSRSSLNILLENALNSCKGQFNLKTINEFDELMSLGGAFWFTNHLVRFLFQQNDLTHLNQAVDLAFGLFHLDLEQCAIVLLRDILPRFLLYKPQQENLFEPIVTALVRLTVVTSFGAISQLESLKKCKLSKRNGHRRNYDVEIYEDGQVPDLKEESLHNTPYFFEMPKSKSSAKAIGNDDKDSPTPMELDDFEVKQGSSSPTSQDQLLQEPIYIEWIRFLNLLLELSLDNEFNARSLVPQAVLEQIVLCLREDSSKFLQFVSFDLLEGIIRASPDMLTFEQLLSYLTLNSPRARKTGAHLLCQLELSKIYGA